MRDYETIISFGHIVLKKYVDNNMAVPVTVLVREGTQ